MQNLIVALCVLFFSTATVGFRGFREEQLRHERVQEAYHNYHKSVEELLRAHEIPQGQLELYIRILKWEKQVEVWGKGKGQPRFQLLRQYPICAVSGKLGPKQQKGDRQIPEGFYCLNRFHPASKFHLSLGLNYPNRADSLRCTTGEPGGDIFIHGGCVTVGCIPITNSKMEELYVLAVEAQQARQGQIPVHLFPGRMKATASEPFTTRFANDQKMLQFWGSLRSAYLAFEKSRAVPVFTILEDGSYSSAE